MGRAEGGPWGTVPVLGPGEGDGQRKAPMSAVAVAVATSRWAAKDQRHSRPVRLPISPPQ